MPIFRFLIPNNARHKDHVKSVSVEAELFIRNLKSRGHTIGPKDGTALVGATLIEGGRVELKDVDTVTALILDIDGKFKKGKEEFHEIVDPEWALGLLSFRGVAHTSYNHTPEHPKYRIILPLREPVTTKQHHRIWWYFFEKLARKIDPACKDASRIFYLPRAPDEEKRKAHWIRELKGSFLSYTDIPETYEVPQDAVFEGPGKKQGAHRAKAGTSNYASTDPTKLVPQIMSLQLYQWAMDNPGEVSREAWRGLATNLAASVVENQESVDLAREAFHKVSEPDPDRYNAHITDRTFTDALKSAQQYGPMTYAHFALNGVPEEICSPESTYGYKSPIAQARGMLKPDWTDHLPKGAATPTDWRDHLKEPAPFRINYTNPSGTDATEQPGGNDAPDYSIE